MRTLEEQTAAARQVLRGVFGFDGFRPGQEAAIGALLSVYRTRFLGHKFVSCGGPE